MMQWKNNALTELLGISVPIIQAPMAGASTPEMVIAATKAGALGSLGTALQSIEQIQGEVAAVRQQSNLPFNMNFFAHERPDTTKPTNPAVSKLLSDWHERLGTDTVVSPSEATLPFNEEMCQLVLDIEPSVVSFHFGLPNQDMVQSLKDSGFVVLSSATSVSEAVWLSDHGVDAVIAQGYEAGGHNGWFLDRGTSDVATTLALVPRIVDAVDVPVVAAGGISDGRGIAAAMMLGAQGVQIGTALLASPECAISEVYKQAILDATGDETTHTKAFSGREARGLVNDYTTTSHHIDDWPDFPTMNAATGPLRKASSEQSLPDAVSLWSGQAAGLVTQRQGVQAVIEQMIDQADDLLA
jgi:nitronate monooxygenase